MGNYDGLKATDNQMMTHIFMPNIESSTDNLNTQFNVTKKLIHPDFDLINVEDQKASSFKI
jgi:hypothetical protein